MKSRLCVENDTLCEHVCVRTAGRDLCVCPQGSVLQEDGRTCSGFPPVLLFTNVVDIRKIGADENQSTTLLEEPDGFIVAMDYDPVQRKMYFADSALKRIEKASLDGGLRETLFSDGLGSPGAVAVDWIHRQLYWSDKELSSISRSGLNGFEREIFIDDLEKPGDIAVHPQAQKIFWTDTGSRPVIERSGLDRGAREVLVSSGILTPSGLAVDYSSRRLYWCDLTTGLVESAGLDGSDRRMISQKQVGHPFDVAVLEDTLWVSDWTDRRIYRMDMTAGRNFEPLHIDSIRPAALVVLHPRAKPGTPRDPFSNKTQNGENVSLSASDQQTQEEQPLNFTEKMKISDEGECVSLRCGANTRCVRERGHAQCRCARGFARDGHRCVEDVRGSSSQRSTARPPETTPPEATPPGHHVTRCPASHHSYCLHHGVCFYFPEMDSYACNCVSGYVGERCQFTDVEWWELQRVKQEKRRNVAIALSITLLVTLLSISACVSCRYRSARRLRRCPSDDEVVDIHMSESEVAAPQVYGDEHGLHGVGCS